jgi:hypothetical protein
MLKIDDRFSIKFDKHNTILLERVKRLSREGKEFDGEEEYYYPTVETAFRAYINKSLNPAENVKECLTLIEESCEKFTRSLKEKN